MKFNHALLALAISVSGIAFASEKGSPRFQCNK